MKKIMLFVSAILLFSHCDQNEDYQNIKSYYFPIEELQNGGSIYEYAPIINDTLIAGKNDIVLSEYFRCEYFLKSEVLVTTQFDKFCRESAIYTDEVVNNGVMQLSTRLFEYADIDSSEAKMTEVEIEVGNVFPFEVKEGSSFLYKINYKNDIGGNNVKLAYKRVFKGMTTHMYKGQSYECVEFELVKRITVQNLEEGDFYQEISETERYAKGLGLVYYTSLDSRYELVDILEEKAFIKKCDELFFRDY